LNHTKDRIRVQVLKLAKALGHPGRAVGDDEALPQSGLLDSASILELILWVENEFSMEINQEDLSMNNFGTVQKIADYIEAKQR
jgi:D-alanine--poly(phosphoribitol) ligase subunit 2